MPAGLDRLFTPCFRAAHLGSCSGRYLTQTKGTTRPGIRSRFEQGIYLSVGALLLIGWALYIWGRDYSVKSLGNVGLITQVGSIIVVLYALALMAFSVCRSLYARRLMVSAISVIVVLGLVELGLQLSDLGSQPPGKQDRIDTILDQRSRGIETFPAFWADLLRQVADTVDSDLFLSQVGNSSVVQWEEDDGLIIMRTDENGFRNLPGLYDETDSFDVFLLGDSFTEGCCVPDGFTIADQIRQSTHFSVYNGGIAGAGLVHKLAVFIEYGLPKEPTHVFLIMPEGLSLGRALNELKTKRYKEYYSDHQGSGLLAKRATKDRVLREVAAIELNNARQELLKPLMESFAGKVNSGSKLVQLIHNNQGLIGNLKFFKPRVKAAGNPNYGEGALACNDPEFIPARRTIMKEVVSWLDGRVKQYGGSLYIVYVPTAWRSGYSGWPECEHDMVIEVTKELGVPLIDIIPVMSKYDDPTKIFAKGPTRGRPVHPNRDGYRLIAEQIVQRLGLPAEGQGHRETAGN